MYPGDELVRGMVGRDGEAVGPVTLPLCQLLHITQVLDTDVTPCQRPVQGW